IRPALDTSPIRTTGSLVFSSGALTSGKLFRRFSNRDESALSMLCTFSNSFGGQGIAAQLIRRAVQNMQAANAAAVETIYEAGNQASAAMWHGAGFAPWMVHAYRML